MKRFFRGGTLALLVGTLVPPEGAAATAFTLEASAPEGFADLTEPQQLVADLYYGSSLLGAAQVTVTPGTVRFENPAAVFELLPATLAPEMVRSHLHEPQLRRSERVCRPAQQTDCGFLARRDFSPYAFGLIYDESRFRIDLFFDPEVLPKQQAVEDPFLPDSSSDGSFVQALTGSWSGVHSDTGPDSSSASLFGRSILSFGESGLHSQWSAQDGGNSQVYQLHWARDYRGKAYSLGLIQPLGGFSSFTASPYLYGIEYRTSRNSRTDNSYQRGAPLEVNMPVRGRVEVRRDNRLLHSALLEAGNRLLDTSSLPGGAYELEIRTFDESGRPLAQYTEFFSKDALLPPPGEWRWSLQAGKPAQLQVDSLLPEQSDDYLVQAGAARRLFDNMGLFANGAATSEERLLELGGRWVHPHLELSPSLLTTDSGDRGYRLHALVKTPWFNLNVIESRLELEETGIADGYRLLNSGFHQRSATISAGLLGGQLALRYNERDRVPAVPGDGFSLDNSFSAARQLTTLEYRRDIFRNRHWQGDMTLAHSDADGQQLTTVGFRFRLRDGHWNHSGRMRSDFGQQGEQDLRLGIDSTWSDRDLWAAQLDQQLTAEAGNDQYFLSSNTRLAGHRGYLHSTLQYLDAAGDQSLNYVGSFSTSLMSDGESFAWGGEKPYDSAVLVDIEGSDDQDFEILVDGVRRGYAKGNARSLISLPSFGSYDITLRPRADGFYEYTDKAETVTLYPGNVARTGYRVQPLIVAVGRITRGDTPVAGAKIAIGEFRGSTDEFGVFQMEMRGDPRTLELPPVRWGDCYVDLPEQSAGDHWINLGAIDLDTAQCGKGEDLAAVGGEQK